MRNTQDLKNFISKWKSSDFPSDQILYDYKPFCLGLMYEDEELIRETTSLLKRNVECWAKHNSPVYKDVSEIRSKHDLMDKSSWYVASKTAESQPMATSGSTSGAPFSYLRWEPFLYFIEATNHYDLIMDEFMVKENPDVLYFFNTSRYDASLAITSRSDSDNFMEHHGIKRKANVHYVNFGMFQSDKERFFRELIDYFSEKSIDVVFGPGPSVNSMCHYIRQFGIKKRLFGLLSNSNEKLMAEDASFLLDGYVDDICDHMRCWDGGATFFTCRHKNYHLLDNLSWCEDVDGKLVSTDYFSFPSPFVRYWNGDFCRISDTYERCECGRLYRDFEFLENRPFSLKGRSILEIKAIMDSLRIRNIKQVRCSAESVEVVSYSPIQEDHKQILRSKFRFNFKFTVEK
jgi:hypothetical protein